MSKNKGTLEEIVEDEVSGIKIERHTILKSGHYYLTMIHEKKASKRPSDNPEKIRNAGTRNLVQCIRWLRVQLHGTGIKQCSYQLLLALVAKYLGTRKKNYIISNGSATRTTKMYPQRVYDLTKAIHFIAFEYSL